MLGFNLLPWRKQQQAAIRKQYLIVIGVLVLLTALIQVYSISKTVKTYLANTHQLELLNAKARELELSLLQQTQLTKRLLALQQNFQYYKQLAQWPYTFLLMLSRKMPVDSYLMTMNLSHRQIKITGYASTLDSIHHILNDIRAMSSVLHASLQGLSEQQSQYHFSISAQYND